MKIHKNLKDVEATAEEEKEILEAQEKATADETKEKVDIQTKADLKASAKAKLIAGEALTEDEANTIVL